MEQLEYLLKEHDIKQIREISWEKDFTDTYKKYAMFFLDKSHLKEGTSNSKLERREDKGILLIENGYEKFYDGDLWTFENMDYIGRLDYLFTVPLWDWWINPIFSREKNKNKDKSVLIVDKFKDNKEEVKETLFNEGFEVPKEYDLNKPQSPELFLFYDYLTELLPMNFAREINRIEDFVSRINSKNINFILRGGYFLKEFFDSFKGECNILNPNRNDSKPNPGDIYLDDCIGSMRTFTSLGFSGDETFNFCCLNSTLPQRVYKNYFPNINFSLPNDLLNIYSCRLFEENPRIIGLDYSDEGLRFYDNPIRDKMLTKIKTFQKMQDLENKTYKLARELINYGKK